jgi:hypothetical protein
MYTIDPLAIAGYVSVCVQLHCILVFTVFHYKFLYIFIFICLKGSASLIFFGSRTKTKKHVHIYIAYMAIFRCLGF